MHSHSTVFDSWKAHSKYDYNVLAKDLSLKFQRKAFLKVQIYEPVGLQLILCSFMFNPQHLKKIRTTLSSLEILLESCRMEIDNIFHFFIRVAVLNYFHKQDCHT